MTRLSYVDLNFPYQNHQTLPPIWEVWFSCFLFFYVPLPDGLTTTIPMWEVVPLLLSKIYLLWNRIRKVKLLKSVLIPNYHDISWTIMVFYHAFLRCGSTRWRFTRLTFPMKGYTTYLVPCKYFNGEYFTTPHNWNKDSNS